jgi:opacity protein-like surface antigen
MKYKFAALITVILLSGNSLKAQFDIGGIMGTCLYQGDITNNFVGKANFAGGINLRYNVNPYIAVRGGLTYGRIAGDDKLAKSNGRKKRNLNFKSPIVELSLVGEYNVFGYNSGSRRRFPGMVKSKWSPYLFGGISYFMFNPTTTYLGETVNLSTIQTEANKSYSLMQVAIPFGIGVKYNFERFWTIGFEMGYRKTFTDYLDDVSGKSVNATTTSDARAIALSDRSVELTPDGSSRFDLNFERGNKKNLRFLCLYWCDNCKRFGKYLRKKKKISRFH